MAKKIIIGNLKMNMENVSQRDMYCKQFLDSFSALTTKNEVVLCPPQIYVEYFCSFFKQTSVYVGGQDCFWELYGSYTGNTSSHALASVGARYVIIGHSERRKYDRETNDIIIKKIKTALRSKLIPIFCVGFLTQQDEISSIQEQIRSIVYNLSLEQLQKVIVAYEPVHAIGSGHTSTIDDIHTMVMYIRSIIAQTHDKNIAQKISILYGGSVTMDNVAKICSEAYVDGVLIGRASLSGNGFARLIHMVQ